MLFFNFLSVRKNRHEAFFVLFLFENYFTIGQSEKRMIFSHSYILTWEMTCTTLTNDDVTGNHTLTAIYFYSKTLTVRLATVSRTTNTFFMCHDFLLLIFSN